MSEVSRFFGMIVTINYNDHPPPHFHVRYGGEKAIFDMYSFRIIQGRLSPRALGMVIEWAAIHQQELLEDWSLARQKAPLKKIAPLE